MLSLPVRLRVLVVEDSAEVRDRLCALLAEVPGLRIVGVAEDEATALARYTECNPDAVILDIRLRTGSGLVVLEHIKRRDASCLVMILTNSIEYEFRRRCLLAGADCFLDKSRDFRGVVNIFRQRLGDTTQ